MTTATKNEIASQTATWAVLCKNHDHGAADVDFVRKTEKDAERSANLFRQCGYKTVEVKRYTR
jgi:hypothetical protein